jgi:glycosyltransferase involved in cell wall biosynthesis
LKTLIRARHEAGLASSVRPPRRSPSRPRVLFVSDSSALSGAEASLCQTLAALDTSRLEPVAVVTCPGTLSSRLAERGVSVICPHRDLHGPPGEGFRYVRSLLSDVRPEIIHFNSAVPASVLYACLASSVPLVQHVRVADFAELVPQLRVASRIVAVSRFVQSELATLDIALTHVRVIHNGVDVQQFAPPSAAVRRAARAALGLRDADLAVVCIARFSVAKRVDLAVRAVAAAHGVMPSLRLFIVGESFAGDTYDDVRRLVDGLGMAEAVTFLNFVDDVRPTLSAADVLLLTAAREPLSRAVLEAMAMAVPCIVPDDGGLAEVIEDGVTGKTVRAATPDGFAQAITGLLSSGATDTRYAMGLAARRFVAEHLTAARSAAALEEVFTTLLH